MVMGVWGKAWRSKVLLLDEHIAIGSRRCEPRTSQRAMTFRRTSSGSGVVFENDLFGKPASTPDQVRAGFLRITLSLRSLSNTL
jgi:hypothetical protein